jgi:hypothetical protein
MKHSEEQQSGIFLFFVPSCMQFTIQLPHANRTTLKYMNVEQFHNNYAQITYVKQYYYLKMYSFNIDFHDKNNLGINCCYGSYYMVQTLLSLFSIKETLRNQDI